MIGLLPVAFCMRDARWPEANVMPLLVDARQPCAHSRELGEAVWTTLGAAHVRSA